MGGTYYLFDYLHRFLFFFFFLVAVFLWGYRCPLVCIVTLSQVLDTGVETDWRKEGAEENTRWSVCGCGCIKRILGKQKGKQQKAERGEIERRKVEK